MSSSTTPIGPDFTAQLITRLIDQIGIETAKVFRMIWDAGMTVLMQHWVAVLVILFVVLIYAFIRALMGHWWILGSVLYNYLYFGTLFFVGLIWGPETFANDYFKIFLLLLYITCYLLVGKILSKIRMR